MLKSAAVLLCAVFIFSTQACTQHKVEVAPVEIKPIHITIDVNIKVDKALDDFFGDIDEDEETADETPSVQK
jgi:Skp family chaperone for outer membrane proteins